jgi:hypothetical protein
LTRSADDRYRGQCVVPAELGCRVVLPGSLVLTDELVSAFHAPRQAPPTVYAGAHHPVRAAGPLALIIPFFLVLLPLRTF